MTNICGNQQLEIEKALPYVVLGNFYPPTCLIENFVSSNWLGLQFNNLTISNIAELKTKFKNNPYLALMYNHFQKNGITLLFSIDTPITASNQYILIWYNFIKQLIHSYQLNYTYNFSCGNVDQMYF